MLGISTPTLTIPYTSLPPGGSESPLRLTVGVVPVGGRLGSTDMTWNAAIDLNMSIVRSPLVARIRGGSRDVPAFYDVVLDASISLDPDRDPGSMLFFWTCREVVSGRVCAIASVAAPVWKVSARDMRPGLAYDFRVLVLKGDRSSSATVRISVAERSSPVSVALSSSHSQYRVNPNERLVIRAAVDSPQPSLPSLQWRMFEGVVSGTEIPMRWGGAKGFRERRSASVASLVCPPNTLPPRATTYRFRLTCTLNGQSSSAEILVEVNAPPSGGRLRAQPSAGTMFEKFALISSSAAWTDESSDLPLRFSFGYVDPRLQQATYLTDPSRAAVWPSLNLPAGVGPNYTYSVFVQASDVWGGASSALTNVTVWRSPGSALAASGTQVLLQAEGSGDPYATLHIIDALAIEEPPPKLRERMARSLVAATKGQPLTTLSATRTARSVALVSARALSPAAIGDCVNVLEMLAACTRRNGLQTLPCVLTQASASSIATSAANLLLALQRQPRGGSTSGSRRRLVGGDSNPNTTTAHVQSILDSVGVVARGLLNPLASGESASVETAAFSMEVQRYQEADYHGRTVGIGNTSAHVVMPAGGHFVSAAIRNVDTVVVLFSGSLPFFQNVDSEQKACISQLTDVQIGNVTQWHERGLYRSCFGYPSLSSATVEVIFLDDSGVRTSIGNNVGDNSSLFVVNIPTTPDLDSCIDIRTHRANGTLNCSRWVNGKWVLDGVPTVIKQASSGDGYVIRCEHSAAAFESSSLFGVMCAPAAQYDEIDLVKIERQGPANRMPGLCASLSLVLLLFFLGIAEVRALHQSGRMGSCRQARSTAFAQLMTGYMHRDTTFRTRVKLRCRSTLTCGSLMCGLNGDPHPRVERVAVVAFTLAGSLAVSAPFFQAPVPNLLCESLCHCQVHQLTGPHCKYNCEIMCRSYQCDGEVHTCQEHGTEEECVNSGCEDFEPLPRVAMSILVSTLVLFVAVTVLRALFVWLRYPVTVAVLGSIQRVPNSRKCCQRSEKTVVNEDPEVIENDAERAIVARLTTTFDPYHLTVKQLNPSDSDASGGEEISPKPKRCQIVLVSYEFQKVGLEHQRLKLVKATLEDAILGNLLGADNVLESCEMWTPKDWKAEQKRLKLKAQRAEMAERRRRMKLAAMLGQSMTQTQFTRRSYLALLIPYTLASMLATCGMVVSYVFSRQFNDRTTVVWIVTASLTTIVYLTAVEFIVVMFEPNGPVILWCRAVIPKALKRAKATCCKNMDVDGLDDVPFESSSDSDTELQDTLTSYAWELYHGKPSRPKPPTPVSDRPSTPELRIWANDIASTAEDKPLFRRDTVHQRVKMPPQLTGSSETAMKTKWNALMQQHQQADLRAEEDRLMAEMMAEKDAANRAKEKEARAHQLLAMQERRRDILATSARRATRVGP